MYERVQEELEKRGRAMTAVRRWQSKDGGRHVKIRIEPGIDSAVERCLLQAVLGSDLLRELLSLMRYWDGNPEPSMLFKPQSQQTVGRMSSKKSNMAPEKDLPF